MGGRSYTVGVCSPTIATDKLAIDGPGDGFGYHAGLGWPDILFDDTPDGRAAAEKACAMLNRAYRAGSLDRARDMRDALGLTS